MLTLLRFDAASGTAAEFTIPFDFDKTCFCVGGWEGHGMLKVVPRNVIGTDFARRVKRIALVVKDDHLKGTREVLTGARGGKSLDEAVHLAFLFHNATEVGGITTSILGARDSVTEEAFASLFSFQPFDQKVMVQGLPFTKGHGERMTLFRNILDTVFGYWEQRLLGAVPGWTRPPPPMPARPRLGAEARAAGRHSGVGSATAQPVRRRLGGA